MKKSVLSIITITAIFCLSFLGCGMPVPYTHNGGKLLATAQTPTDGFFLPGNLKYVKENLRVKHFSDAGASRKGFVVVGYTNAGEDGISLKVDCCWANAAGECYRDQSAQEKYEVELLPYSTYVIRRNVGKEAQHWERYVCDHRRTYDNLWNATMLNLRK